MTLSVQARQPVAQLPSGENGIQIAISLPHHDTQFTLSWQLSPARIPRAMLTSIDFTNIKPHLGNRRWAFEELCFLLFASEFEAEGTAIRREGAGGDGGIEGYICDANGNVSCGLQAKHFVGERFHRDWWRQLTESVVQALKSNVAADSLRRYVICTPRTFTQAQQKRWDGLCEEWEQQALQTGYTSSQSFEHWDYSRLEAILLKPGNRGTLLYWFDYPDFSSDACNRFNRTSIEGLHERFIPELHTETPIEVPIHYFLRSEWAWREFVKATRRSASSALDGKWPKEGVLPETMASLKHKFEAERNHLLGLLGDGCRWPTSVQQLTHAGYAISKTAYDLTSAYREHLRTSAPAEIEDEGKRADHAREKCRDDLGESPEIGGWAHLFEDWQMLPDAQFLLVLGGPGSGKTHALAKMVTEFQSGDGRVLFVEGRAFTTQEDPWTQFLRLIGFKGASQDFLDCFSAMARSSPAKAGGHPPVGLLCIDALNETPHREVWLHHLEAFAAKLRSYPNIKLVVSCRSDFADLAVPADILGRHRSDWRTTDHHGYGEAVFDAAMRYFRAYRVRGADVFSMMGEMQNPLFLKTFCETFKNTEVPQGVHGLPQLLKAYIALKARNIQNRIGCAESRVVESLRLLAGAMNDNGHTPLHEDLARGILSKYHGDVSEPKSLYRALCSEGILIENRQADEMGDRIFVRFGFERIWDYLLTLKLLPQKGDMHDALVLNLRDAQWRQRNRGLLELLAIRLAEEKNQELHDVAGVPPGDDRPLDEAFNESIRWRSKDGVTERTKEIQQVLHHVRRGDRLSTLALAHLIHHPWNGDHLHERLYRLSLAERDNTWTRDINNQLQIQREQSVVVRLIKMAESAASYEVGRVQTNLLATSLAWICSTTFVSYRHRVQQALARLLTNRMDDAATLVAKMRGVNDPQILEAVMFGAAGSAANSAKSEPSLRSLAEVVFDVVFKGPFVFPHVIIRHYAQVVLEEAAAQKCLPTGILVQQFRPPYQSPWPAIISEAQEVELEKLAESDAKRQALSQVVRSSRTESMGNYGDWGRYEMGSAFRAYQGRLRKEPLAEIREPGYYFPDRLARRYVLQRTVQLGVNDLGADRDYSRLNRDRPEVERIGKKYQWIALHEFLAYVSDHYRYCVSSEGLEQEPQIRELSLPDVLDPIQVSTKGLKLDESLLFTAKPSPWWNPLPHPAPVRLSEEARKRLLSATQTAEPKPLLQMSDGDQSWTTLAGYWQWNEPLPCWISSDDYDTPWLQQSWWCTSYAVPTRKLSEFLKRMSGRSLGGDMVPKPPETPKERDWMRSFPVSTIEHDSRCADTHARIEGAYFTAMMHDDRSDNEHQHDGFIPSPQMGRLLGVKWTKEDLDFVASGSSEIIGKCVRDHSNSACVVKSVALQSALDKAGLTLVWRLYSWKHSFCPHNERLPEQEYWAVYVLTKRKGPVLKGGGIWVDFKTIARLPW
jgi:hypothetical protein